MPDSVFGSSNEGSYFQQEDMVFGDPEIHSLQEQVSIQVYQRKSSCQQDNSTTGHCRHQLQLVIYCELCDELPCFLGLEDLDAYSMGHVPGEDGGTLNQDQVIWSQTGLDK